MQSLIVVAILSQHKKQNQVPDDLNRGGIVKMKLKRVYEESTKEDGTRILVDRLWPRGLTKQKASVDIWLKEIAPSTELRKWFQHDPEKWGEFKKRYLLELKSKKEQIEFLKMQLKKGTVTLLYAAKDEKYNEAIVLKELLSQ